VAARSGHGRSVEESPLIGEMNHEIENHSPKKFCP
jgi:hypothetical protein